MTKRLSDPMQRAREKPKSLRLAVTAKCWDCNGGDADPRPRLRIRDCPCTKCPLWPVRPWQNVKDRGAQAGGSDTDE